MKITYQKAISDKQGRTIIKVDLDGRNVGRIIKTADPGWQYIPKGARTNGRGPIYPGGIEALEACKKSLEEIEPRFLGPEANAILAEDTCPGCGNPHHAESCKPTYENTYWAGKGKHETEHSAVAKLIPPMDEVPNADRNPALEQYRVATNCYYDLYNNGLGNRNKEFIEIFGDFDGQIDDEDPLHELTQEIIDGVENKMNEIILAAYAEQITPGPGPMPWCERCKSYHHKTAEHIKQPIARDYEGQAHHLSKAATSLVNRLNGLDYSQFGTADAIHLTGKIHGILNYIDSVLG